MSPQVESLSVVVPAYQERERIPALLGRLVEYCKSVSYPVEVIVVDDSSTDGTADIAQQFADDFSRFRVIRHPENAGKGAAVRTGMLASTGGWRTFIDADGSVDPFELDKLLEADVPVAVASIGVPGAILEPPQPWYRVALGKFGNVLIRLLVLPEISDSQRGCKLFRGDVAEAIFSNTTISRWGFDVEALALARGAGHEPMEIPVRWEHRPGGTIGPTDYVKTLREVLAIRRRLGRQRSRPSPRHSGPRRL